MSAGVSERGLGLRLIQALALAVVVAVLYAATWAVPQFESRLGTVTAFGFFLLAGTLCSALLEVFRLPHLSGYLLAGVVAGPHLLHLVDHATLERLNPLNTLALALIAIAGGAELRLASLREFAGSVGWALLLQCVPGFVVMAAAFWFLARYIPFTQDMPALRLLAVSLLWGTLAVSRSPSALLGILAQTRAKGPLTTFSLAFVMASDVVVLVLMAVVMMLARPLITPGTPISLNDFNVLGHEMLGSVSVGTTLGLLLAAYLRFAQRHLLLVLVALGLGMSEFMRYVRVDPLLSFLTAGFVVQNLSSQGAKLLASVEQMGSVVFVVFFASAGAHLDLPLLKQLWPVALGLCSIRALITFGMAHLSSHLARDLPTVRRYGFTALLSQAGLTLGLSLVIARTFPEFGEGFRSLAIATVAINEIVGPIVFKFALDKTGESTSEALLSGQSLAPSSSGELATESPLPPHQSSLG